MRGSNTLGTVPHADDIATSYGSRGPAAFDGHFKPDLTAPGNRIPSLLVEGSTLARLLPDRIIGGSPQDAGAPGPALLKLGERLPQRESPERPHPAGSPSPVLFELSGSSMAVPFVSGTVAIMLQANPELGPGLVKSILQLSAIKLEQPHMLEQGNGLVNTRTAVELSLAIDARSGRLQLSTSPAWILDSELVIAGAGFAQGQSVLLAEPVAANPPMWGSGLAWDSRYPSRLWDRWTRVLYRGPMRRPDSNPYVPRPDRGFWPTRRGQSPSAPTRGCARTSTWPT